MKLNRNFKFSPWVPAVAVALSKGGSTGGQKGGQRQRRCRRQRLLYANCKYLKRILFVYCLHTHLARC